MKKSWRIPCALVLGLLASSSGVATAAQPRSGVVGPVVIDDDIYVPEGQSCLLMGTVVNGDVEVRADASLESYGVLVAGNLRACGAEGVRLDAQYSEVVNNVVDGDAEVRSNAAGLSLRIQFNQFEGDLRFVGNTGPGAITDNVVGGDFKSSENTPPPVVSDNQVAGSVRGG